MTVLCDTVILGVISDLVPVERIIRTQALLNGDVTPLYDPIVNFTTIQLQNKDALVDATGRVRKTQIVRFTKVAHRPSIFQQLKGTALDRIQSVRDQLLSPGKRDRALRLVYGQLPCHPQRIWAQTQFIADLQTPLGIALPAEPPVHIADEASTLDSLEVTARLTTALNSDASQKGDSVSAVVTKPVFDQAHQLLIPEGTKLEGTISQSKASRSFGRNGQIRFAFQHVLRNDQEAENIHGTLTGAEGNASQNVTVDQEGGVSFVAPLLLGVLAAVGQSHDDDGSGLGRTTVASNGFGLIARIVALTANDANVATAFGAYAFAKSVYFRFLVRGHPVAFPSDTLVEVQLSRH